MSEGKKINDAATVSGLPAGGFVLVADSGGGLKRLSVDALLADVRGAVKVGGRNLLKYTGGDKTCIASVSTDYNHWTFHGKVLKGDILTFSLECDSDISGVTVVLRSGYDKILSGVLKSIGYNRYAVTSTIVASKDATSATLDMSRGNIVFRNPQLERGNVPSDFQYSPEDYMPTNSTLGGVKERPLYALVVTPKGGVRHEQRGESADGIRVEQHHAERLDGQRRRAGLGRAEKSGDILCQLLDDESSAWDRGSRSLQGVMSALNYRASGGVRLVGTRHDMASVVADEVGELAQVGYEHYFVTTSPEGSATERSMAGKEVAYV